MFTKLEMPSSPIPNHTSQRVCGNAVSSPTEVRSKAPATWPFRMFVGLESCSWSLFCWYTFTSVKFLWGSQPYNTPQPNFCWGPDPHRISAYGYELHSDCDIANGKQRCSKCCYKVLSMSKSCLWTFCSSKSNCHIGCGYNDYKFEKYGCQWRETWQIIWAHLYAINGRRFSVGESVTVSCCGGERSQQHWPVTGGRGRSGCARALHGRITVAASTAGFDWRHSSKL